MPYEPDIDKFAEAVENTDGRYPIQIGQGMHVAPIAGSSTELETNQIGFSDDALRGTYNELWEDDYVVVEPFDAPRGQSYVMQLVGLDERDIWHALDDEELGDFQTGGAVVHGPDHGGYTYDMENIDDRVRKEYVGKQGLIPAGRDIRIGDFVDPDDMDIDVTAIAQEMSELKGDDYTFRT